MSKDIKPIGKNCELFLKELEIEDYAIGKNKVNISQILFFFLSISSFKSNLESLLI